jgi:formate dehydrogenase major subunit
MAECHPVGFQWVMEAKARGAKVIHIDPRFTRTSAVADTYVPLRAGSDIAFLGGIVNYVLSNGLEFREYVERYTNASHLISEDFRDTEDLDGLFSGFDAGSRSYDPASWQYEGTPETPAAGNRSSEETKTDEPSHEHGSHGATVEMGEGGPKTDPSLMHPRCVFQILKRHFARYTPEMVQEVCGTPKELFVAVAQAWTTNSKPDRTTCLVYSVGWTHHSVGVQYIRTGAILQLLLGNMGRPGGGILALRGHASIQGSTDIPTLYNLLPGYLPMPQARHDDLAEYVSAIIGEGQKGFWPHAEEYLVSLLKAWWGDAARAENDWAYHYLPKISGDHGTYQQVLDMLDRKIYGYFLVGENPAVGSAHGKLQRLGMANLEWLVVRDFFLTESATFWHDAPEIATGELRTKDIGTEVFFFPAAAHTEKDGSFTNTQRLVQWHHKATEPQGDQRSDLHFYYHLGRILRDRLAASSDERDRPLLDLTWNYPTSGPTADPSAEAVLAEINGVNLTTGEPLATFNDMKADGTTAGGCWIYTGIYADGVNQAARRKPGREQSWVAPEWAWAWPANRRTLYNRASADPDGRPWSERKAYVWWDADAGTWTGYDVPDFVLDTAPDYRPPGDAEAEHKLAGDDPFVMQADGKGWLYAPSGLVDGPLPTHYEAHESPVRNPLYGQQASPARQVFARPENLSNPSPPEPRSDVFPYIFTTYRLTEHHTAGAMSRNLPYLAELQPEMFCEVSPALAAERGLVNGGWATIITARTAIEARVLVTDRMAPLRMRGRVLHQVGLPYHWGQGGGLSTGDSANDLLGLALDPNVHIQESKVASCDIQSGRRPTGPALLSYVENYRRRAAITTATGNAALTPVAAERHAGGANATAT